jgi:diadenosine tetraphosphatase ApaH/serine/threonine PP2A family protein phosphatase
MYDHLLRMRPHKFFAEMLDQAGVDLLLTGNTHTPHHKLLQKQEDGRTVYRHAINPGSVGRPKDGNWMACYAIITLDTSGNLLTDADAVKADFYRVAYDLGKAVKAIKKSNIPVYFGGCLISG